MAERPVKTLLQMQRSMGYGPAASKRALGKARETLKEIGQFPEVTAEGHVVILATLMAVQLAEACNQKGEKIPIDLHLNGEVRFVSKDRAQKLFHSPKTLSTPEERVLSIHRVGENFLDTLTRQVSLLRNDEIREARSLSNAAEVAFINAFSENLDTEAREIFRNRNVTLAPLIKMKPDPSAWRHFSNLRLAGKSKAKSPGFNKAMPGTRWAFAKIDRQPGVNDRLLSDLVKARVIHPASRRLLSINQARIARKLSPVSQEDLKEVYLIPLRWAGKPSHAEDRTMDTYLRDSDLWGRSEFFDNNGHFLVAKGIGVSPSRAKMLELTALPEQFGSMEMGPSETYHYSLFHHKFGNDIAEQDFRGGMTQQSVDSTSWWLQKVRDEYQKAIEEKDPVALFAKKEGIDELPIPEHIVSFKPFEAPVSLNDLKRVRDTEFEQFGQHAADWRVWFYKSPHPHRLFELGRPTYPVNLPAILRPAGIKMTTNGVYQKGKKISPNNAVKIVTRRHTVGLALLVHILSHRLNGSFGNEHGNVLSGSNPGPSHFPDWDTVEEIDEPQKWKKMYRDDLRLAKHTIGQTAKYMGLKVGAGQFPVSENLKLFGTVVRKGRMYALRTGLLRAA